MTAQQNNFENAYTTRLACGIYTVLSSMYAVREWSIDFVEQSHINNARNWIAAVCHEIKKTVNLEQCKCGERYEQWDRRPAPSCSRCAKNHVRKVSPGKTGTERGGSSKHGMLSKIGASSLRLATLLDMGLNAKHRVIMPTVQKTPPKWQKNDLVSGGHGQAGSWRGQ